MVTSFPSCSHASVEVARATSTDVFLIFLLSASPRHREPCALVDARVSGLDWRRGFRGKRSE